MGRSRNGSSDKPERRIPISKEGRISFRPGKEHPLDVQIKEAQSARELMEEQLEMFLQRLHALASLEGVADRIEDEDTALRRYLAAHYTDFFHVDHLEATFLWLRRRRAVARLQAAQAALTLVEELLAPDPFVDELLALLAERRPESVEVDRGQLTGNAHAARARLAQFEARLQEIRAAITRGNGWVEETYVRKPESFRPEVIALAIAYRNKRQDGTPVPPEVLARVHAEIAACLRERRPIPRRLKKEATHEAVYGPYYRYRWLEPDGFTYTISLGRLSDRPEGPLPFRPYVRLSPE